MPFPALEFLEYFLPELYPELSIQIEEHGTLGNDIYAYYDVMSSTLHIDNDVYNNAYNLCPRDRFTIVHEIAHVLLLDKCNIFAARSKKYETFRDPEWQANELAAELLAPHDEIDDMTIAEVVKNYHVSKQMARIQKS